MEVKRKLRDFTDVTICITFNSIREIKDLKALLGTATYGYRLFDELSKILEEYGEGE
jgi:hypothetical protein